MGKEYNDYEREYDREYNNNDNCCYDRQEELRRFFKRYKGQPVEIITESGMKYCGIIAEVDEDAVTIIDGNGRTVRIEFRKIEAVIEPRMKLNRLCADNDCCCHHHDDDDCDCCTEF